MALVSQTNWRYLRTLRRGALSRSSFVEWGENTEKMAKHHPDLVMCRKQPGIAIGRLCEKCDGKCVICDSYVRPNVLVRICDECNYGSYEGRCVICGGPGISDAYFCRECTQQEKDRDGCPKIVNLGSSKTDLFYERKKYGFKKRWYPPRILVAFLGSLFFILGCLVDLSFEM